MTVNTNLGGASAPGAIEPRPATALLDAAVARFSKRPCIDFLGRRWTYGEIGDLVDRAAAGFRRLGVRAGTRVGLCLPNTPYSVICWYAVLRAGASKCKKPRATMQRQGLA